jgi:hypothetical protein
MNESGAGIGWGTLALINAGLAQTRGRKGLNWFLLSLLLGPIATFLLVTWYKWPPDYVPPEDRSPTDRGSAA